MAEEKQEAQEEQPQDDGIERGVKDGFVDDDDPQIQLAEAEMLYEKKEKTYGSLGRLAIHHPTVGDEAEINLFYGERYQELLLDSKLMTTKRLAEALEEKGVWGKKDDKKLESILEEVHSKTITIAQLKVQENLSKEQKEKLAELEGERDELELEYGTLFVYKSQLFQSTIEKKAEEDALNLKVIKCVRNAFTDEPVWKTVEEFEEESSTPEMKVLLTDCVKFWRGVDHPFLERLALEIAGNSDTGSAEKVESPSSKEASQS